ncbi:MAG: hypothetical protein QOF51_2776 [Chloroflexota bacterium]|jgi:hypothetical protein|nr:hypothetical protein [Chloroflexota bacterium]
MPAMTHARSIPTLTVILAAITIFAVGLMVSLSSTSSMRAHAQSDCSQPASDGCPVDLNSLVQASLTDASTTHNWLVNVQVANDFTVTLTNLPGDYEVTVYGPDPDYVLLGQSNNPGTQDEVVGVSNIGPGTYWITVDSPSGDASDDPYTLLVTSVPVVVEATPAPANEAPTPGPTAVSFGAYGTPVTRPFLPY